MTIEQRAEDYSNIAQFGKGWQYVAEEGYIKGATEQYKIDIEKACRVYADLLSAQGYDIHSISTELARMTKAMEEQQ